jgi:hypothetical protein
MSKKQPLGKCKKHPGYLYKNKPRKTTAYPKGCPRCWELWQEASALVLAKKETGQAQKGEVLNPKGKNQHGKDIHQYARQKLKKGHVLVDRLDTISQGLAPGSTVKDEMAASQLLYKIIKDDQQDDKPQDIRVVVLNLADSTFKEYKDGA